MNQNGRHGGRPSAPLASLNAKSPNLWLAIGDETGEFEVVDADKLHGVGLILARPQDLVSALGEEFLGKTVRWRMNRAIEGLEPWLDRLGPEKSQELKRHHVREAWRYLDREAKIRGVFAVDSAHADPVLNHLLGAFSWLSQHPRIASVGIYGKGREVMSDFWRGSDPMAAIGALYGRALALMKPFLGPAPRIRVLAGRRSEAIDSLVIRRSGQDVPPPMRGETRQTTRKTGGDRVLLEAMESEFWKTLEPMAAYWAVPSGARARQTVISGFTNDEELGALLENEDPAAARLIKREAQSLNSLADLACSTMLAAFDWTSRPLRVKFPEPIGANVRFFNLAEVR